jgi:hypothetical protein
MACLVATESLVALSSTTRIGAGPPGTNKGDRARDTSTVNYSESTDTSAPLIFAIPFARRR